MVDVIVLITSLIMVHSSVNNATIHAKNVQDQQKLNVLNAWMPLKDTEIHSINVFVLMVTMMCLVSNNVNNVIKIVKHVN